MNLVRNFVLKYVRTHLGHEHDDCRNEIFRAINDGLHNEFREDTVSGLIYFGVSTLLENDDKFYTLINSATFMNCEKLFSDMIKDGISHEIDKLIRKLKVNCLPFSIMLATAPSKVRYETFVVRKINEIYEKYTTNKATFVRKLKSSQQKNPHDSIILADMTEDDAKEFCNLLNKIAEKKVSFSYAINHAKLCDVYKSR